MKHKELVPYAHVVSVNRSVEFYLPLGEFRCTTATATYATYATICSYMASGEAKYASRRLGWVVPSSVKWRRAKLSIYIATRVPLFYG